MTRSRDEWSTPKHALEYLERAGSVPHRAEGEAVLLEHVPRGAKRILDLGTGDGRLLALVGVGRPGFRGVALDYSETMLEASRRRFSGDGRVELLRHDLKVPLPGSLGRFDAVVSSFAIHHLPHARKRALYREVFELLLPGGAFCNLEHVASPTRALHASFLREMGQTPETEDRSNRLLDVHTQLGWLRTVGFADVDCHWKWLELALLAGVKPRGRRAQAGGGSARSAR